MGTPSPLGSYATYHVDLQVRKPLSGGVAVRMRTAEPSRAPRSAREPNPEVLYRLRRAWSLRLLPRKQLYLTRLIQLVVEILFYFSIYS